MGRFVAWSTFRGTSVSTNGYVHLSLSLRPRLSIFFRPVFASQHNQYTPHSELLYTSLNGLAQVMDLARLFVHVVHVVS